jgi:enamine deaminase RidA (YjgF/YER057c/UK114 family)
MALRVPLAAAGENGRVNRTVTATTIAPPAARYAHAVLSDGPSQIVHTAGIVGARPDGTVPDDVGEQAAVVWESIAAILAEAGMAVTDIVSMTTYVVAGEELAPVMAARDQALGDHLVASTLVTVPALARPAWRVEVAVIAAR